MFQINVILKFSEGIAQPDDPKGEGAFSLLPEGEGLGMRGAVFTL
jgi:hypothetical protein